MDCGLSCGPEPGQSGRIYRSEMKGQSGNIYRREMKGQSGQISSFDYAEIMNMMECRP